MHSVSSLQNFLPGYLIVMHLVTNQSPFSQGHLLHPPQTWSYLYDSQGQVQGEESKAVTSKSKGTPKNLTIKVTAIYLKIKINAKKSL